MLPYNLDVTQNQLKVSNKFVDESYFKQKTLSSFLGRMDVLNCTSSIVISVHLRNRIFNEIALAMILPFLNYRGFFKKRRIRSFRTCFIWYSALFDNLVKRGDLEILMRSYVPYSRLFLETDKKVDSVDRKK